MRASFRAPLGAGEAPAEFASLLPRVHWDHLLWLGRQQGGLVSLGAFLRAPALAPLCPAPVAAQLADCASVQQLLSLEHARELCQLHDLFAQHAIPALSLDPALNNRAGGFPFHQRSPGSRLSYLVPAADLAPAASLVSAAGHPLQVAPDQLIHRGRSPVRLNRRLGPHPAFPRFWLDPDKIELGGRTHPAPSPLHWLCWHAAGHTSGPISLSAATGIVLLCRRVPPARWHELWSEADVFAVRGPLAHLLTASHAALGLPAPAALPADTEATAARPALRPAPRPVAPFLPTPPAVARRMLALAGTTADDLVCDLGCGDGRIALLAAEAFGARGWGVDLDPARIAAATTQAQARHLTPRVTFTAGDLFAADLSAATVVTCYLLPQLQQPLLEKLRREARPGTRIVSHEFIFPDWPPEKTELIRTGPMKMAQIYLWRLP